MEEPGYAAQPIRTILPLCCRLVKPPLFAVSENFPLALRAKTRTPLHFVAEEGHDELSEILMANGVDVNAQDNFGQTPLHLVVVKGHKGVVESLLAKGVHVHPRDNAERTPLHYASGAGHVYGLREGYLDIAQLLIDRDANINATDTWGWTPLPPKQPHFHPQTATTYIQPYNPLSANSGKICIS